MRRVATTAALRAEVERLNGPPPTSHNSSQPPSRDWKANRPAKKGKARGAKPGHAVMTRPLVDTPDRLLEVAPDTCAHCGHDLRDLAPMCTIRRQITELPEIKPLVLETQQHEVMCPACHMVQRGDLPADLPAARQFGPRLEEAQGWTQRLDEIAVRLDTLSPTSIAAANSIVTSTAAISITRMPTGSLPSQVNLPSQSPLSAFNTPASQPANLFDRVQLAESILQELQALERDLQQIETPVALTGLQKLSPATLQAFATWSTQVMDTIATPTSDAITAAQTSR